MSQTGAEPGTPWADDRLASVLRPVRAGNGFEEALEQILQVVRLGLVPGGERLPAERELAERLGVSRGTLRGGLKGVQGQGGGGAGGGRGAARPVRRDVRTAARRGRRRGRAAAPGRRGRPRGRAAVPGGAGGG